MLNEAGWMASPLPRNSPWPLAEAAFGAHLMEPRVSGHMAMKLQQGLLSMRTRCTCTGVYAHVCFSCLLQGPDPVLCIQGDDKSSTG